MGRSVSPASLSHHSEGSEGSGKRLGNIASDPPGAGHFLAKDNSFEIRCASDVHQCKTLIKAGFACPNPGSDVASFSLSPPYPSGQQNEP